MINNQSQYEAMCEIYKKYLTCEIVPVVRCGECRNRYLEHDVWMCRFGLMMPSPDGFCSYGEKVTE